MYQVRRIEGKGLGCVASIDILQGSLIMSENPQIPNVGYDNILAVWEFYQRMSETDQLEYMTLHDKYEKIEHLPSEIQQGLVFRKDLSYSLIRKCLMIENL